MKFSEVIELVEPHNVTAEDHFSIRVTPIEIFTPKLDVPPPEFCPGELFKVPTFVISVKNGRRKVVSALNDSPDVSL